jgi:hypothetical protein
MSESEKTTHWSDLYHQALFEEDRDKLPRLLEQAHRAVQERVHELWYGPRTGKPVDAKERRELDAAMYYLGLLRKMEQEAGAQDPIN